MFQDLRRIQIVEILKENGTCTVADLCKKFSVSEPTIRNDLMVLEKEGKLKRQHGGAFLDSVQNPASLELAPRGNEDLKKAIGLKAAELVNDGDSIIIDSGSTTTELAKHLAGKKELAVVTNALNIALILGSEPSNHILVIGGELKTPTLSLTGTKGVGLLDGLHVGRMFLATGGITVNEGLTYPSDSDIEIKKRMMAAAKEIVLLADSSKIGQVKFYSLGGVDLVDTFVTDSKITPEAKSALQGKGIKVIEAR